MLDNTNLTTITTKCKTTTLMKITNNFTTKEQMLKTWMENKTTWRMKTKMLVMMLKVINIMKFNKMISSSSTPNKTNTVIITLARLVLYKQLDSLTMKMAFRSEPL
jgi:hypothetical protein